MRRIRIIKKQRELSFTERLEDLAEKLSTIRAQHEESSPLKGIDRQIRLTLDLVNRWRGVHKAVEASIRREEFDLEQELERLDVSRRYQFPNYARERLKGELRKLEKERRQLAARNEDQLQPLHAELLDLLTKRRYLNPENGD